MSNRFALRQLKINGYRALLDVDVRLGPLNVIIGPNGSGKSSVIDVLSLASNALGGREKLSKLVSNRGGMSRLLTLGKSHSFLMALTSESPDFSPTGPMTYEMELVQSGLTYRVEEESLSQDRGQSQPFRFIDGDRVFDPAEKKLIAPEPPCPDDELLIVWVPRTFRQPEWFRSGIGSTYVHEPWSIDKQSPLRLPQTLQPTNLVPSSNGSDLFSVLYQLRSEDQDTFERVGDTLRAAFPSFDRLEFPAVAGGQITLAWHSKAFPNRPFFANELSPGTLRFLLLTTLLLSQTLPSILLIDEIEESLHPQLIHLVSQLLLEASERAQIFVATQSPALIRWFGPEHIIVADSEGGVSRLSRGADLNLGEWLASYRLDQLWEMGQLGGRP